MAFESYGNRPTNFVGKDGFHWWVGQIEQDDKNDKNSNRYKVRIIGHHLADCDSQGTDALPWANTVAPTTAPFSAAGGVTTKLKWGDWVIGFFMDSDMAQQPYILGSIGTIRNARGEDDPALSAFLSANPEGCRAFKNFAPGPIAGPPYSTVPLTKPDVTAAAAGQYATAQQPPGTANNPENAVSQPPAVAYSQCPGSALNEAAVKCTIISQADCPTGKTASMIEIVLSEMFKAISQSGGQVGSYLTSKVTGYARSAESFVMGYVNKIMAIIFQSYSWLKGKLYNLVQQGVQYLINALLSLISDKGKPKNAKPPYDPKRPEKLLDKIQKFLTDQLKKIGCQIEDLYDRILKFLTDFVMGLVDKFWSEALCGIESMVNSLMSSLQNFITNAINSIMAPLLNILQGVAAPLNKIFGTIAEIMSFLGITCAGLPEKCKKVIKDCGEGPKTKAKGLADDLDALLSAIAADTKPSPAVAQCEDALAPVNPELNVAITGGTPDPTPPTTPSTTTGSPTGTTSTTPTTPTLSILVDPQSSTKNVGDSNTFFIVATTSDGATIDYQWQRSDSTSSTVSWVDIPGATSSNLTLSSIAVGDDGDGFRCRCRSAGHNPDEAFSDVGYIYVNTSTVRNNPRQDFFDTSYGTIRFSSSINLTTFISNTTSARYSSQNTASASPLRIRGLASAIYTPVAIPSGANVTYALDVTPVLAQAGSVITFTLRTTGISNGTQLNYFMFGFNLQVSDFVNNSLIGTFTVVDNIATSQITVSDPVSFSDTEVVYVALQNGGAATQFAIQGNPITPVTPDPVAPPPTPPIACPPIVSNTGQIISIGICAPGTRYLDAPAIYIQGNGRGYGASAVAVLDDEGFVSSINVVRPGRGYPPNPPTDNLDCIITGFTIIKPGFGYDIPPAVFVDGELDVAEAIIANGVLVDIKVKNKSKTFTENPLIKIVPVSRGVGAIAIANIACLDRQDVREIAEVVGPTPVGEYIDCP